MRLLVLTPFLALVACSGGSEPAPTESDAPAAEQMSAGQWEMTTEVTQVVQRDRGAPAIDMPKGSKSNRSVCLAEADSKQPPPALLMPDGFDCKYRDSYVRGGRLNGTLACTRGGLGGTVAANVNGTFTADAFEGTASMETSLSGEGDARMDTKLTGRRTGACTPAPAAAS